ncbi:MAG TPA: M1 family aminopeptidase, partial [Terriglobales bacterium]
MRSFSLVCLTVSAILLAPRGTGQVELKSRPPEVKPAPIERRALANRDAIYVSLRKVGVGQEQIAVKDFTLQREAGVFVFRSGTFQLLEPVRGNITGAVFHGDASFTVTPPIAVERRNLAILSKGRPFEEEFSSAVFRFTDGTEEEIRKAATGASPETSGDAGRLLDEVRQDLKKHLKENLDVRLLEDVMSSQPGGKFLAFIKGNHYSKKLIYDVDPHGVVVYVPDPGPGPGLLRLQERMSLEPEEVALIAWDYDHFGVWTAFHKLSEYAGGTANGDEQNGPFRIEHQKLDIGFAKNARLDGRAITTITALRDGVRVLALDLFPTLRVEWVASGETGEQLSFIQEEKEEDADFAVILPRELKKGERYTIITKYGGEDAVEQVEFKNYFPVARENWYPNLRFGQYATYEMTFHIPKDLKMVATGKLLRTVDEGNESVTEWVSETPLAVAGFNFGNFKSQEDKDLGQHYVIETDANEGTGGPGSTVTGMKKAMAEAQIALDLYTNYFGQMPYQHVAMTQQAAVAFGQSWPGLVYLPQTYFQDSTVRHMIGFKADAENSFFRVVGAHELAHQWWGHMVGFNGYRDQWMSEGFAEMSAALFLQAVYHDHGLDDFHEFWAHQRKLLTDKNGEGKRAIDVGSVTMGYRLATAKSGFNIPRNLLYPKGAYILHMVRVMMQDSASQDPDAKFKAMMHDFTKTYANRAASTEDFKAMTEKYMTREMDLDGNRKMDWFFDDYVYGTDYP